MLQATDVSFRLRIALSIRRLLDWIGRSSLKTAHFAVAGTLFWRAEVQKHGEKLATTMPTRSDFKMTERSWPQLRRSSRMSRAVVGTRLSRVSRVIARITTKFASVARDREDRESRDDFRECRARSRMSRVSRRSSRVSRAITTKFASVARDRDEVRECRARSRRSSRVS